MKTNRLIILFLLALTISFGSVASVSAYGDVSLITRRTDIDTSGMDLIYSTNEGFIYTPNSFEAWIKLDTNLADDTTGGIIMGSSDSKSVNWEITTEGRFLIVWNVSEYSKTFDGYDFRTGEWEHLTVVRDATENNLKFYVNGELNETVSEVYLNESMGFTRYSIGMDGRQGLSTNPFKGEIKQVAVYANAISEDRVAADFESGEITEANSTGLDLMGSWVFDIDNPEWVVNDASSYHNHAFLSTYDNEFSFDFTDDSSYTFAVIPDTQYLALYDWQKFYNTTAWIADNASELNINYAMHMGDIQDHGQTTLQQWNYAATSMSVLDGVVPYSVILGNHDYDANYTALNSRLANNFNNAFPYSKFSTRSDFGGVFEAERMDNAYFKFNVGGAKYMVFALEFGPRTEVLNWASGIIEANKDHRVIITTHAYLTPSAQLGNSSTSGTPTAAFHGVDANNGEDVWDLLVNKHSNIFMVLSGHHTAVDPAVNIAYGRNGNKVFQAMIDLQGYKSRDLALSYLALMRFNESTQKMYFYLYNPIEEKFLNIQSQFIYDYSDDKNPAMSAVENEKEGGGCGGVANGYPFTDMFGIIALAGIGIIITSTIKNTSAYFNNKKVARNCV